MFVGDKSAMGCGYGIVISNSNLQKGSVGVFLGNWMRYPSHSDLLKVSKRRCDKEKDDEGEEEEEEERGREEERQRNEDGEG